MNNKAASIPQERDASVTGRQVRFLDRDPIPLSLRGKEGRLERMAGQEVTNFRAGGPHHSRRLGAGRKARLHISVLGQSLDELQ